MAPSRLVRALGIDAEPDEGLPDGVLDVVALPSEQAHLHRLLNQNGAVHWDRLLFSAKEAVYKAWFPLTRRWLEFDEVAVTFTGTGSLTARVLAPGPVTLFHGRWTVPGGPAGDGRLHAGRGVTAVAEAARDRIQPCRLRSWKKSSTTCSSPRSAIWS